MSKVISQFQIEGMTCTACSSRIEKNLNKIPGIRAEVNFASEKATIHFLNGIKNSLLIENSVKQTGYSAFEIFERSRSSIARKRELLYHKEVIFFISSAILTLPLIVPMILMFFGIHFMISPIIQFFLAFPVQFFSGWRFYKGAYHALRSKSANMDVLVALDTTMAFFLSVYFTFYEKIPSHLYYEASATVITLVRLGKLLEERAKGKTSSAIEELIKLQPKSAHILRDDLVIEVSSDQILVNDIFLVKAGENIPVDGIIIDGESSVDESMLTGESIPKLKVKEDKIFSGTLNLNGFLKAKATEVGEKTYLSKIVKLVEQAMESKAPIQKFADRVSGIFVPIVVIVSFITFLGWYFYSSDLSVAIINAVSVLVIACPCALGLATPTAIMVGSGKGSENGILIKDASSLEKIGSLQTIVFDKTGTITEGNFKVSKIENFTNFSEDFILQIAASLEQNSTHPLAISLTNFIKLKNLNSLEVENFQAIHGKGVMGTIGGIDYYLGSISFIKEQVGDIPTGFEHENGTKIWISDKEKVLGSIILSDKIKTDAIRTLSILKQMNIKSILLSGDNNSIVKQIAENLEISEFYAEILPEGKADKIKQIKSENTLVGMVGDGVNDAIALAEADVSFSVAKGSGVAIETADVAIVRNNLITIPIAILLSRKVIKKIKENLFFAFFYNTIGIPLAAFGLLNPMIAGAAMAFSSVSVISNSLLLKNWKPVFKGEKL